MNCAVHADTEASGYCRNCGKAMCAAGTPRARDVLYCEDCLAQQVGLPAAPSASAEAPATPVACMPPATPQFRKNHGPRRAFLLGLIPGLVATYYCESTQ